MTCSEEEAKTKWCPFSRVMNAEGEGGANRWDNTIKEAFAPSGSTCVASRCMAWKWKNELAGHDLDYMIKQHGSEEGPIKHTQFCKEDPLEGYCGLAKGK